jgi:FtsP/CotA-like multicopper oxidase with cupredoxin domain
MDHSAQRRAGMDHGAAGPQTHPASESHNPFVDMQATSPTPKLDDPGIGLRNNGRTVLTYSMLHSAFDDPDGRDPGRDIELHLTGHMERFTWGFNGQKFSQVEPLRFNYGERLRIVLVNDTMMTHPHPPARHVSDLEDEDGNFHVRKHTIGHAARQQAQLSRARRCAGRMGVPLPPAVPHGSRDDARSAGGR